MGALFGGQYWRQQTINSNMSRQHNTLLRGISHDDRLKAKTKKHRNAQQDRRQDYPPCVLGPSRSADGNVQVLLGVAQSMSAVLRKYGELRFKAKDQKLLGFIINELTLLRQLQEHERENNRAKIREVKGLLEHIREKKAEAQSDIDRVSSLMTSGSPRSKNGVIACEMSPPSYNMPLTLYQRKIEEENRDKTTFEAIKKKEMCFSRVFEHVDRIADKLNLSKGEKKALSFKNFVSRIEAAIQAIGNREVELKSAIKDAAQCQVQLTTLKAENDLLAQQNLTLRGQVNGLTVQLQSALTNHRTEMASMLSKCTELQQDFQLIVKEKLDAETALSQQGKRHREAIRGLQRKGKKLRQCLREAKYLQAQLRQTAKEHRNNLECYSRETFNEVICAYTQELVGNAAKNKRQKVEMERERLGEEEMRKIEAGEKMSRMAIVKTLQQDYTYYAREKILSMYRGESFAYINNEKCEQSAQTLNYREGYLAYHSSLIQYVLQATKKKLTLCNHAFNFTQAPKRQFILKEIQTDQEQEEIHVSHSYSQTISHQSSTAEVQTATDKIDASVQSSPPTLASYAQQGISIPQIIRATADVSTAIIPLNLAISPAFDHSLVLHKQTTNQEMNTEHQQIVSQGANTSHIQTEDQQTNTLHQSSIHYEQQISPHLEEPTNHQPEEDCSQSILDLLIEAEQVINVPEICLLREEIVVYRGEIDRLSKTIEGLKNEREKEHVFQFCY